jgi:uncharacterized protein (TIGR02118 family)
MIVVSVMYPAAADAKFDMQYYLEKHIPMVGERWGTMGLRETKVLRGVSGPEGGAATYPVVALLTFDSADALQKAMAQHGKEIVGDVANFTNITPIIQVNDVLI